MAEGIIAKHEEEIQRHDRIEDNLEHQLYLARRQNRMSGPEVESE